MKKYVVMRTVDDGEQYVELCGLYASEEKAREGLKKSFEEDNFEEDGETIDWDESGIAEDGSTAWMKIEREDDFLEGGECITTIFYEIKEVEEVE